MRAPSALRARVRARSNDRPTRGASVEIPRKSSFHFPREAFFFLGNVFSLAILHACIAHVCIMRVCSQVAYIILPEDYVISSLLLDFCLLTALFFSLWAMEILWGIMGRVYFEHYRTNTLNKRK